MISDIKTAYQQEKGRIPITSCHDKKCNKIGMVVVGFDLNKYDESRRSHLGCCFLGVSLDCVVPEFLYLRWFLCGELISDGPAETVMVGEC